MSSEMRKIEFDIIEVHAALKVFSQKTGLKIPNTMITSVRPDGAGTGRIRIVFSEGTTDLIVGEKDLTAALLVFCQDKHIPVPKGAKKVLKVENDKVTLLIKLN